VPYLAFLYFLGYEKNQTPKVALFGHQFLLLFVLSTWELGTAPSVANLCVVWCFVTSLHLKPSCF